MRMRYTDNASTQHISDLFPVIFPIIGFFEQHNIIVFFFRIQIEL